MYLMFSFSIVLAVVSLSGCASGDVEPNLAVESPGEIAVAAVYGAVASGSPAAAAARASVTVTACPTPTNGALAGGCSASGSALTLAYAKCYFLKKDGGSYFSREWSGSLVLTASTGTVSCGTYPAPPGGTTNRAFGSPTTATVADAASNTHITTLSTAASGFAASVSGGTDLQWDGAGSLTGIDVRGLHLTAEKRGATKKGALRVLASAWDHTLSTTAVSGAPDPGAPLVITNATSGGIATRSASGTIVVQLNGTRAIASSTFTAVTWQLGQDCTFPVSGSVTTKHTDGTTERLDFSTTCGRATSTDRAGVSSPVTLTHAL